MDGKPSAVLALRGWGTSEPALAGITSFAELLELVHHSADFERQDAILLALARLASIFGAGDPLAAQILLGLMTTGLAAHWHRMVDLDADRTGEEVEQALAAELAIRIRTWRGHRAVAANLVRSASRDVRARLLRDRGRPDSWANRTSLDSSAVAGSVAKNLSDTNAAYEDLIAAGDLLDWAVRSGLMSEDDLALVRARRLYGLTDEELAAAQGVPRRTLQRRCQRAANRLGDALAKADSATP